MIQLLKYRLKVYKDLLKYLHEKLIGREIDRENDYWGYIANERMKLCRHKELRKVTATKFYCANCGKTIRYIEEKYTVLSELLSITIASFVIYKIFSRRKNGE